MLPTLALLTPPTPLFTQPPAIVVQRSPVFTTGDLASPYLGTQEQEPSLFDRPADASSGAATIVSISNLSDIDEPRCAATGLAWRARCEQSQPGRSWQRRRQLVDAFERAPTDCDGNKVTARTKLTQECIYQKKTAEIRARQAISSENARYKVERLEDMEKKAADAKALREQKLAAQAAKQAKYAAKTRPAR